MTPRQLIDRLRGMADRLEETLIATEQLGLELQAFGRAEPDDMDNDEDGRQDLSPRARADVALAEEEMAKHAAVEPSANGTGNKDEFEDPNEIPF